MVGEALDLYAGMDYDVVVTDLSEDSPILRFFEVRVNPSLQMRYNLCKCFLKTDTDKISFNLNNYSAKKKNLLIIKIRYHNVKAWRTKHYNISQVLSVHLLVYS